MRVKKRKTIIQKKLELKENLTTKPCGNG